MACAHAILVLIAYAQNPILNVHAEILSVSRDQDKKWCHNLHLHSLCLHKSSKGVMETRN